MWRSQGVRELGIWISANYCKCMAVLTKQHSGMDKPSRLGWVPYPKRERRMALRSASALPERRMPSSPHLFFAVRSSSRLFLRL